MTCPDDVTTLGAITEYNSEWNFNETLQISIMPKVTYPRPCPTCGKEFNKRMFFYHKKQCGTTENRYHCLFCSLTFNYKCNLERHVQQQHSKTPLRFTCPKCNQVFTSKHRMKIHWETVCAELKPCYKCVFCNASFTRQESRQRHAFGSRVYLS